MEPKIISLIGVIGSGKDFRAGQFKRQGYVRVDFKDELLDMASDIVGYNVRDDYDWFKANIIGVMRPSNPFMEGLIVADRREAESRHPMLMTGRKLLQRLGTEGMRKRDQDYWVKAFARKAEQVLAGDGKVVNADCRFRNEVKAITSLDPFARFIFCDYRSHRYDPRGDHESEAQAQALLNIGFSDGVHIEMEHFEEAWGYADKH